MRCFYAFIASGSAILLLNFLYKFHFCFYFLISSVSSSFTTLLGVPIIQWPISRCWVSPIRDRVLALGFSTWIPSSVTPPTLRSLLEVLLGRLLPIPCPGTLSNSVTFRDPEAARRACADPTPIIDGRRANCNLASLGRPRPALSFGWLRTSNTFFGPLRASVGGLSYQQPVPFNYQQGYIYALYGYPPYGPEYTYTQGLYNPYQGQQYLQLYGVLGTANAATYPYGQLSQSVPSSHGYTTLQGHALPSHQIVQFGGPSVHAMTTYPVPSVQSPYHQSMALWDLMLRPCGIAD